MSEDSEKYLKAFLDQVQVPEDKIRLAICLIETKLVLKIEVENKHSAQWESATFPYAKLFTQLLDPKARAEFRGLIISAVINMRHNKPSAKPEQP